MNGELAGAAGAAAYAAGLHNMSPQMSAAAAAAVAAYGRSPMVSGKGWLMFWYNDCVRCLKKASAKHSSSLLM